MLQAGAYIFGCGYIRYTVLENNANPDTVIPNSSSCNLQVKLLVLVLRCQPPSIYWHRQKPVCDHPHMSLDNLDNTIKGAITALLTNPIWVVKVRLFTTNADSPKAYKGLLGEL
jgi:hypothetical protein